jgi:hypothetical protein
LKNAPFRIETAAGRIFEVPHREFVAFSSYKTSLIVNYSEYGEEHFAIVPLLVIIAAMACLSPRAINDEEVWPVIWAKFC